MKELIYVDGKPVGTLADSVFTQRCTERSIFKQYNAKGMDVSVYRRLQGYCHTWQLIFTDTRLTLSIPFLKIATVGEIRQTGAGRQYLVKLSDFTESQT